MSSGKISLEEFGRKFSQTEVSFSVAATENSNTSDLESTDEDFFNRLGLGWLMGVENGNVWEWDKEGSPTDDLGNPITYVHVEGRTGAGG